MIKEFIDGFQAAGKVFDKLKQTEKPEPVSSPEVKNEVHYRLSWVLYLTTDFGVVPERASFFSKFHSSDQRIPVLFTSVLKPFEPSIEGVFAEPTSPNEDLGYLVFADQITAIAVAGRLSTELEIQFAKGIEQTGYTYGELELTECCGTYTAPSMSVKREVLLNPGFDGARQAEEVITVPGDFVF